MIKFKAKMKLLPLLFLPAMVFMLLAVQPSMAAYLVQPDAYWQLEETDPGTTGVADDTGTIANGSCTNCPTSDTGQVGLGFVFEASSTQSVAFADNAAFDFAAGAGISIELWMKLDGIPSSRQVMIGRADGSVQWWLAVNDDGTAGVLFIDSDGPVPSTSLRGYSNVANNQWHHIVGVRDGSGDTLKIYVDGVLEGTEDQSGNTSTDESFASAADVTLGSLSGGFWYDGMLDNVAVYGDTALTAEDIQQNYLNASLSRELDETFAPVFSGSVAETVAVGFDATLLAQAAGNPLPTYTGTGLPTGASIDNASGVISWLPSDDQIGANVFSVNAANGESPDASQNWTVTVEDLCVTALDAYWKLEETDPGTTGVADDTGAIANGSCTNCPTSDTGQVGLGFVFEASSTQSVAFADNAAFDFAAGAGISIELWMKLDGIPSSRQVMIGRADGSVQWWLAVNDDGTAGVLFIDSDGPVPSTSLRGYSNVANNQWHHIVGVRDGSGDTLKIYVDGVLEGTEDQSGNTSTDESFASAADVTLGSLSGGFWYDGMLDEIAIYNSALSAAIVAQHANADMQQSYCNSAPTIDSTAVTTADEGVLYTYDATATDPEGHALTWTLAQAPSGMVIGSSSGQVTWTPGAGVATADVTVKVTDQYGATNTQAFTIAVTAASGGGSGGGGGGGGGCFIGSLNF